MTTKQTPDTDRPVWLKRAFAQADLNALIEQMRARDMPEFRAYVRASIRSVHAKHWDLDAAQHLERYLSRDASRTERRWVEEIVLQECLDLWETYGLPLTDDDFDAIMIVGCIAAVTVGLWHQL